ncbi:MAG: restriction endonuclease subunit R, partial [Nitrospiraceae bacterium]|nr:restriction endonuclease subunit R [Nitrospiraceae bacterium]
MPTPEEKARQHIDEALAKAGWSVQDLKDVNLAMARGIAVRNFPLTRGHGFADYLLYIDGKTAGVIEAKKEGVTLTGVEIQAAKYSEGLPPQLPAYIRPLPFLYQSTGIETRFTNGLDPQPRSRQVFSFHRPSTHAEWLARAGIQEAPPVQQEAVAYRSPRYRIHSTLRGCLQQMPLLITAGLWPAQI